MYTLFVLGLLWLTKRAEGRMAVINESDKIDDIRENRKSAAYYNRRPPSATSMKPQTVEEINDAIKREQRQLDATHRRIERNHAFFEGK